MAKIPVEDIQLNSNTTLGELKSHFQKAGGFVASKVSTATSIIQDMGKEECTKFLSFPADIMATGTRGILKDVVATGHIDVVVTTCGTLDHDIASVLVDDTASSDLAERHRLAEELRENLNNVRDNANLLGGGSFNVFMEIGRPCYMRVDLSTTVGDARQFVESVAQKYTRGRAVILVDGKTLEDDTRTLVSYGVRRDSRLRITSTLDGGAVFSLQESCESEGGSSSSSSSVSGPNGSSPVVN